MLAFITPYCQLLVPHRTAYLLELTHLFNDSFMTPGHYFLLPTLAPIAG